MPHAIACALTVPRWVKLLSTKRFARPAAREQCFVLHFVFLITRRTDKRKRLSSYVLMVSAPYSTRIVQLLPGASHLITRSGAQLATYPC